jgi:hypothetical protein
MIRRSDIAMARYELLGYLRGSLPGRFLLLMPAGVFLAVWSWRVASPFAAATWVVLIALEPRVNNILYHSPVELDALSLLPADWRRIVIVKNLSTAFLAISAMVAVSVVLLYFTPGVMLRDNLRAAALYFATVCFPLLSFGNQASVRYPRPRPEGFPGGLYETAWMTVTLLAVSVPYFLITDLVELPWLCVPYGAATSAAWYYRSVRRTARQVSITRNGVWKTTETS